MVRIHIYRTIEFTARQSAHGVLEISEEDLKRLENGEISLDEILEKYDYDYSNEDMEPVEFLDNENEVDIRWDRD
jgi:hypothetical protein